MRLADKYVLILSECRSLTEAAQKIGISQPAISLSISKLEKQVGYQIFDRKSSPISLTRIGEIYVDYLRQLNKVDTDYEKRLSDLVDTHQQQIVVGGPSAYVASILTEAAARFYQKHSECMITVKEASLRKLAEETESGEMDCFISTTDELPAHMVVEKLKTERIFLCIPKEWAINEELERFRSGQKEPGHTIDFKKLQGLPRISLLADMPLQIAVDRFCEEQGITLKNTICVDQTLVGLRLAAKGIGIFFASDEALRNLEIKNRLEIYELPPKFAGRQLYIARHTNRYVSNSCKAFIEELKEAAKL